MSNEKVVNTKLRGREMRASSMNIRKIAMTGMLSAVSAVLMFLSFSVPFMPPFIKLDFSELPALFAAFALGPVSGVIVCLVKNLVNVFYTTTGGIGELCNFLLGVSFVLPLRINPIFKWSIERYGYLYFSSNFCANTVLPVCDAPAIKIIIL